MLNIRNAREAKPASLVWIYTKTLFHTVIFWITFLVLIPAGLYYTEDWLGLGSWRYTTEISSWASILLFCAAGSLGLTSSFYMALIGRGTPLPTDCASKLVIVGPYRYVRNPMAIAGLSQGIAVGIFLGSPAVTIYPIIGGLLWQFLVRPWEEKDLAERFGEPYEQYLSKVICWIPKFPGYQTTSKQENVSL